MLYWTLGVPQCIGQKVTPNFILTKRTRLGGTLTRPSFNLLLLHVRTMGLLFRTKRDLKGAPCVASGFLFLFIFNALSLFIVQSLGTWLLFVRGF